MDGSELEALAQEPGLAVGVGVIRDRSIASGNSPIDWLLADGQLSSERAARVRAASLGIGLASPDQMGAFDDAAWLPPGLVRRGDLELIELGSDQLVVSSSRPTARLAREISTLFPDAAIAWRVSPGAEFAQDPRDLADGVSGEHPVLGAPGGL
jgi:hypothetical protein